MSAVQVLSHSGCQHNLLLRDSEVHSLYKSDVDIYVYLYMTGVYYVSSLQVDAATDKKIKAVESEVKLKEKDIMS